MKHFWEKNEYIKWGVTAFLVIAGAILFYMFLLHGGVVLRALRRVLHILSPIIWGLVIAYILWPETKFFQHRLFLPLLNRWWPKRNNERASRVLAVILAITVALLFITVLLWIVIPQVYTSVESIVSNAPE